MKRAFDNNYIDLVEQEEAKRRMIPYAERSKFEFAQWINCPFSIIGNLSGLIYPYGPTELPTAANSNGFHINLHRQLIPGYNAPNCDIDPVSGLPMETCNALPVKILRPTEPAMDLVYLWILNNFVCSPTLTYGSDSSFNLDALCHPTVTPQWLFAHMLHHMNPEYLDCWLAKNTLKCFAMNYFSNLSRKFEHRVESVSPYHHRFL